MPCLGRDRRARLPPTPSRLGARYAALSSPSAIKTYQKEGIEGIAGRRYVYEDLDTPEEGLSLLRSRGVGVEKPGGRWRLSIALVLAFAVVLGVVLGVVLPGAERALWGGDGSDDDDGGGGRASRRSRASSAETGCGAADGAGVVTCAYEAADFKAFSSVRAWLAERRNGSEDDFLPRRVEARFSPALMAPGGAGLADGYVAFSLYLPTAQRSDGLVPVFAGVFFFFSFGLIL